MTQEFLRALAVATAVTGEQHPREILLGAGEPGPEAHSFVHRERVLEVVGRFAPASQRRRE